MEKIFEKIIEKVEKGEEISPFLFIDKNTEILNEKIKSLAFKILEKYEIPKAFLYHFEYSWKNISVEEMRDFTEKAILWTPYKVQIFFIENISKLTNHAWNSLLKFLEEPWAKNIIFLSNNSENFILETILSRCQIVHFQSKEKSKENDFYQDMIKNHLTKKNNDLIAYFFKNKFEKDDKDEYIKFLDNLIIFAKKNLVFIEFLDEILDDINAIKLNNVNPRPIVDKWIFRI